MVHVLHDCSKCTTESGLHWVNFKVECNSQRTYKCTEFQTSLLRTSAKYISVLYAFIKNISLYLLRNNSSENRRIEIHQMFDEFQIDWPYH